MADTGLEQMIEYNGLITEDAVSIEGETGWFVVKSFEATEQGQPPLVRCKKMIESDGKSAKDKKSIDVEFGRITKYDHKREWFGPGCSGGGGPSFFRTGLYRRD
jgi:hypothetical protein